MTQITEDAWPAFNPAYDENADELAACLADDIADLEFQMSNPKCVGSEWAELFRRRNALWQRLQALRQ